MLDEYILYIYKMLWKNLYQTDSRTSSAQTPEMQVDLCSNLALRKFLIVVSKNWFMDWQIIIHHLKKPYQYYDNVIRYSRAFRLIRLWKKNRLCFILSSFIRLFMIFLHVEITFVRHNSLRHENKNKFNVLIQNEWIH